MGSRVGQPSAGQDRRYSSFDVAHLLALHQRERMLMQALRAVAVNDLGAAEILDIGCGTGAELVRFVLRGARPAHCHGIDIDSGRVAEARRLHPGLHVVNACVTQLPWADASFDLVSQFTTFSSILNSSARVAAAAEITRVLRPGGHLIWYDFWLNPVNPRARGIRPREVRGLFPGFVGRFHRLTLAPPLARRIAPWSWMAAAVLQEFLPLQTHYLGVLSKGDDPTR